jgi:hypothetical protein
LDSGITKSNVGTDSDGLFLRLMNNALPKMSSSWKTAPTNLLLNLNIDDDDDFGYTLDLDMSQFATNN